MTISNVNWNLYKYFKIVYETRSLNSTARQIGVSPSAVLQNIRELGNQLGVVLFTSSNKGVVPTPEADNLYPQIKKIVETLIEQESNLKNLNKDTQGEIKIDAHSWFAKEFLFDFITVFRADYPKIKITVFNNEDVNVLISRKVDLMIDVDCSFDNTALTAIDIFDKDIESILIASKDYVKTHGLQNGIGKDELKLHPFIERENLLSAYYNELRDLISFDINVQTTEQYFKAVKSSLGITTLGRCYVAGDPDIVEIKVHNFEFPKFRFGVAYHSPPSKILRTFIDGLLAFCRRPENKDKIF